VVDGLERDGDDLWVSAGPRFARVDATGRTIDEVAAPPGMTAITCALGGDTGRTLFMAVAVVDMEEVVAGRSVSEIRAVEVT
jgi:sugar lactone lactonase YvrE